MMAKNRELQEANNNEDLFKFKNIPTTLGVFDYTFLINNSSSVRGTNGIYKTQRLSPGLSEL